MKWWKLAAVGLMALLPALQAEAEENFWFDRQAGLDRYQKVIMYPVADGERDNYFWDTTEPYHKYNYELHKRLTRKVKGMNFYELFTSIGEKDQIIQVDQRAVADLLRGFPSEEDRAKAVFDRYASDGYLTTWFRQRDKEIDYSPETQVLLSLESYTQISGGPHGDERIDASSWTEWHTIPARESTRYNTKAEFTLYDAQGKKVMTCLNEKHDYSSFDHQFMDLKDDFVDAFRQVKKTKKNKKDDKKLVLRFGDLHLPEEAGGDEYLYKALWFAFKDEAEDLKHLRPMAENDSKADYRVTCTVHDYRYEPSWIEPAASAGVRSTWSNTEKWKDNDGKEHTMTITRYEPEITDHYGRYVYGNAAQLQAGLALWDEATGQLLCSESYAESDDKAGDALRHILESFYKKIDKIAAGKD